eukprot:1551156-Rhodomonas_salina.3
MCEKKRVGEKEREGERRREKDAGALGQGCRCGDTVRFLAPPSPSPSPLPLPLPLPLSLHAPFPGSSLSRSRPLSLSLSLSLCKTGWHDSAVLPRLPQALLDALRVRDDPGTSSPTVLRIAYAISDTH